MRNRLKKGESPRADQSNRGLSRKSNQPGAERHLSMNILPESQPHDANANVLNAVISRNAATLLQSCSGNVWADLAEALSTDVAGIADLVAGRERWSIEDVGAFAEFFEITATELADANTKANTVRTYAPLTDCAPEHLGSYAEYGYGALCHDVEMTVRDELFSRFNFMPPELLARVIHEYADRHAGTWED